MKQSLYLGVAAIAIAAFFAASPAQQVSAQQTVQIGSGDLGGVVTGPSGPEAGVWVIAETTDLGTKMAKMVVTDDQGRYVLPELPKAKYKVWVRGYGLVDLPKVDAEPGKQLNLTAVKAPNEAAAAEYYPAIYWYSMIKVPEASNFPGTARQRLWHEYEDQTRASTWTWSRPMAASAATSSATRRRARSRPRLAISTAAMRHGRAASSPAKPR